VDYRGFTSIADGSVGSVQTRLQYNPLSSRVSILAPDVMKSFQGPVSMALDFSQTIALNKAPCGDSLKLQFRSGLKVENYTSQAGDNSLLSLDSVDSALKPGLSIRALWEACR
jgi:hypothetical protein